jgi:hypothetical protein
MERSNEQERIENSCVEPISLVFPRRLVQKAMRLPTRIYNSRAQQTAPGAVSQVTNGWAAQDWGQLLTFQGKTCSLVGSFTKLLI